MTVADVMDLTCAEEDRPELEAQLCRLDQKLDYIVTSIDGLHRRVESLEELREDLWPMVQGASHQISRKLHELDRNGALASAAEGVKVAETVATSFTPEDVRLLGENIVSILRTVRNLTQPEVLEKADRAALALRDADGDSGKAMGLFRALRDPEVRRGMTLMLGVLRELGHEDETERADAVPAGS